jgi:hypothetical protein
MSFQSTVELAQGFGVVGELFTDGPVIAQTYTLVSDPVVNTVGNAFTVTSEGLAECGGTGIFAGILVNPKVYPLYGTTAGGTLAPTLNLPDNGIGELLTMGEIVVSLGGSANIGDSVVFDQTDGSLTAIAPNATVAAGYQLAYATVVRYTLSGSGLAVIRVNMTPTINADAP